MLKLDRDGKTSVAYKDTNTGGALSISPKGALFIVQRGLGTAIWQLAPERKMLANRINGDPLECLGGVINDITADSKGGVYFTMGGLFYADAKGTVTRYGENLRDQRRVAEPRREDACTSPTARRWRPSTCSPDGALTNQREFVAFPGGGGDGIDDRLRGPDLRDRRVGSPGGRAGREVPRADSRRRRASSPRPSAGRTRRRFSRSSPSQGRRP